MEKPLLVTIAMNIEGFKKQAKIVDMMLTMHTVLADKYRRRAQLLELLIFGCSLIIVSFTFIDPEVLIHFGLQINAARIFIGFFSIFIFFLSILSLIVDWKGKAAQHRGAFNALILLKAEWRERITRYDNLNEGELFGFMQKSSAIMSSLTPVPDKQFNRLKYLHHKKIEMSKMISANPGCSPIVLSTICLFKTTRKALKGRDDAQSCQQELMKRKL